MGQDIKQALGGVGLLVLVAIVGMLAARLLVGCTPREYARGTTVVENAAAVAAYDARLAECQGEAAKAPEGQQYAFYIACEMAVSRALCRDSPELQREWPRCAEVLK